MIKGHLIKTWGFPGIILVTLTIGAAHAHHASVGSFDTSVDMEIKGEVTGMDWVNPHAWIYLDVTTEEGETEKWQCELGSPNRYVRSGWSEDDVPPGTVIIVYGSPARDGTNTCTTRNLTLEDGTPIFTTR